MQLSEPEAGQEVLRDTGHCALRQQALPLRIPPLLLAGGWKGGSSATAPILHPSGRSLHRRAAEEAGRLLRESQVDQQRVGQEWPGT